MQAHHETITLRVLDAASQIQLKGALEHIEKMLSSKFTADILYSLLMELVDNALKANLKRAFFRKNVYSLTDDDSYKSGMEIFKNNYIQICADHQYTQALEDLDLKIIISLDLDDDRLLIFVENNTKLVHQEEQLIRKKMKQAMTVKNMVEFSATYENDAEIKGLGLAMVIFLIRYLGFEPGYFRIYVLDDKTVARLELPLSDQGSNFRSEDSRF